MPSPPANDRRLRRPGVRGRLLAVLARGYLDLVWRTSRVERVGIREAEIGRSYIGAFWHDRMLWPAWAFRGPQYAVLVSDHADGELIAGTVAGFGTRAVRGSSLRGGAAGLRAAARLLDQGVCVAITPDGPLGPPRRAKPGAVALASLSGAPLVPVAYAARRELVFASWDRFRVPLPWNHAWGGLGEPMSVPAHLDREGLEEYRLRFETALVAFTAEVDRRAGRCP